MANEGDTGLSFEEALEKLERIVERLERENLTLEQSLALFEQGQNLGQYLTQLLDKAELKIKQLSSSPDGGFCEVPFWNDETT